jgi:hydrogenase/urease accessory protein HupE
VLKPSTSAAVRLFGCAGFAVGTALCAIIEGMANNWPYTVGFLLLCMLFVGASVIAVAELFAAVSNEEGLLP